MVAKLSFLVNGKAHTGWKNFSIERTIEAISATFSFDFTDQWTPDNDVWPLNTQDEVQIKINNLSLIKGYIEVLTGSLNDSSRAYTVQGRDATGDLIDCSAPQTTASWAKGISIMNLANQISKGMNIKFAWGEGITASNQRAIPFALERGESVFEALDRMAARAGVILVPDGSGGVIFTVRGLKKSKDMLVEGANAKDFGFTKNVSERFSKYIIEGSENKSMSDGGGGWEGEAVGAKSSIPRAEAEDSNIRRYRPLYIQRRGSNDKTSIEEYAEQEAQIRAGKSLTLTCTVQGWVQSDGNPWAINTLVKVNAPRLGIGNEFGEEYLIAETIHSLSEGGGAVTQMKLVPPDSLIKQKSVDKKKRDKKGQGLGWDTPRGRRPKSMPPIGTVNRSK